MNGIPTTRLLALIAVLMLAVSGSLAVTQSSQPEDEQEPKKAKLGEKAPDFTLTDSADVEHVLADYKERIIVLEWINPECQYVFQQYQTGRMQEAVRQVKKLDKKAIWLAINSTPGATNQQMKFWCEQHEVKHPILLDTTGEVAKLYDARWTPQLYVIDKEGILRYVGAIDDNRLGTKLDDEITNYVVQAVRQLVEDKPVSPRQTKPYGCRIRLKGLPERNG
jgi:peroxiredoxin